MKNLLNKAICPYKAYLNSLNLVGEEVKNYDIAVIVKSLFQNNDLKNLTRTAAVATAISHDLSSIDFTLKTKEKEAIELEITENASKIARFLINSGYTVVDKNRNVKIEINHEDVFLKLDLIIKDNKGNYFATTVHSSSANYTLKELHSEYSLEWYLRMILAEELNCEYPGIRPAKLHLKCKSSVTIDSLGNHLIIPTIDRAECRKRWEPEAERLTKISLSKISCKDASYSKCEMCPNRNLCEFFKTNTKDLVKVKKEKVFSTNLKLTTAQDSLINADDGIYRVLAGAGTGKTTTLANKVVALIQKGVNPSDILLITFTEKGILELKEKIDYWLKEWFITEIDSKDFNIFTFNGYGDIVLKENYARFGYTEEPKLIDSVAKIELISEILEKYPVVSGWNYTNPLLKMYNARGCIYSFMEIIDNLKKASSDPIDLNNYINYLKNNYSHDFNNLKNMIDEYNGFLKDNNFIEYEDQTNALLKLTEVSFKDLFQKYTKEYIICDEFQDTDKKQLQFIKTCSSIPTFHNLIMVGDDSQSIFGWRGADQKIILELQKYFPTLKDIKMVENFRCTYPITELANKVNALDVNHLKKDLISSKGGDPVKLIDSSKTSSNLEVIKTIQTLLANGTELKDIGVIARTKAELQEINMELQKLKIPCIVSVHEFLKDNPYIKNILDFTKYLLDPKKNLFLAEFLQAKDPDLFDSQINIEAFVGQESERIQNELETLKAISSDIDKDLLDFFYKQLDSITSEDRAIEEFKNIINSKNFKNLEELNLYLSKIKSFDSDYGIEKDEECYDAITLMTPHSAKGREYKVIIANIDKFKSGDNEDNRCLFVTITRAIEKLYLVCNPDVNKRSSYYGVIDGFLK